jgi:hypothetical protein
MTIGTTVYFNWYDFTHKAEHVCMGMVEDNSLWAGTKWQDYINVSFQPPHAPAPFCHHFPVDKLSLTPDNVPHDDCYQVCAKRKDNTDRSSPSDAWQQVQQFKQDHWDYQHGHLDTDALDEYYQMWRDAIAIKRGYSEITCHYPEITKCYQEISTCCHEKPQQPKKTHKKTKTTNVTQLSLFD